MSKSCVRFNRDEESFSSKSVLHLGFVCTKILCQYLMSISDVIFDVNIWCQYLMSIFGQYLMSIFDVTIWSLKRNPCKSNIFSIYKRIPCKFNIGFLLPSYVVFTYEISVNLTWYFFVFFSSRPSVAHTGALAITAVYYKYILIYSSDCQGTSMSDTWTTWKKDIEIPC